MGMLYGAIDIHKSVLQAALLDPGSGEVSDARFAATREALRDWAMPLRGRVTAVAIEATSGWRWVWRELSALSFEVCLAEPAQTRALRGRKRQAKNDRLDARWLALLLAKQMLPLSWVPPADIQRLRDLTRLRGALRNDRTRWAQRLHAILAHEGWPCARGRLLTGTGRRWLDGLQLDPHLRALVDAHLATIDAVGEQMRELERELRRLCRADERLAALQTIYGVGAISACQLLAEIGDTRRFRRADQIVRVAGLDPVVLDSADKRRRGKLSKQGSPALPADRRCQRDLQAGRAVRTGRAGRASRSLRSKLTVGASGTCRAGRAVRSRWPGSPCRSLLSWGGPSAPAGPTSSTWWSARAGRPGAPRRSRRARRPRVALRPGGTRVAPRSCSAWLTCCSRWTSCAVQPPGDESRPLWTSCGRTQFQIVACVGTTGHLDTHPDAGLCRRRLDRGADTHREQNTRRRSSDAVRVST